MPGWSRIGAAINDGDAAALKALFSPGAHEQASDIDAGLEYFLSFFRKAESRGSGMRSF
jgi:hypothetical protein